MRMQRLAHAMDRAKQEIGLDDTETPHRRGDYPCVSTGLSFGGGSKVGAFLAYPYPCPV